MKAMRLHILMILLVCVTLQPAQARSAPASVPQPAIGTAPLLQFTSGGHVLGFAPDSVYVASGSHAYRVAFVNAMPVAPSADPAQSEAGGAAAMRRVTYPNLWAGITLTFDAPEGALARSTYRLEAYADPADIRLRYNAPVQVESDGTLTVAYATGAMHESAPLAWQERNGTQAPVAVAFQVLSADEVGFALGAYDPASPLFIDPTLTWNTFLGGSGWDYGNAMAVDGSGNVYVAGSSKDAWGSPVRPHTSDYDAFAAKLDSGGGLSWSTFLGGDGSNSGTAIAVDGSGNVFVTGLSTTTWGSPIRPHSSGYDAFAAKLDNGGGLTWNTFLGGDGMNEGYAIAVDGSGNAYVAGYSEFTWGSPVRPHTSDYDAFAAKLDSGGGLSWNTFLGGGGLDYGNAITVDGNGSVYVAGSSTDTWGSPVQAYTSDYDGFAAKLDSGGGLSWNTFLGGSGMDEGLAIVVDGSGNVYVAGYSEVTWGSPIHSYTSDSDGFVARLDSNGGISWNTFLGGSGWDYSVAIAADGSGNVYVAGESDATWGSPIHAYTSDYDGFAAKLDSGGGLSWNTFLGGSGKDYAAAMAVDEKGNVYAAGESDATWGSPIRPYTSDYDAFVVKLSPNQLLFLPLIMR